MDDDKVLCLFITRLLLTLVALAQTVPFIYELFTTEKAQRLVT